MNIELKSNIALTHILLKDKETASLVANTPQWKETETIKVTVQFNGVEAPPEALEKTLHHFSEIHYKQAKEKYNGVNIDKMVEEKALQLIKEQADNALDKIYELSRVLENSEDLLKPYWERKE